MWLRAARGQPLRVSVPFAFPSHSFGGCPFGLWIPACAGMTACAEACPCEGGDEGRGRAGVLQWRGVGAPELLGQVGRSRSACLVESLGGEPIGVFRVRCVLSENLEFQ